MVFNPPWRLLPSVVSKFVRDGTKGLLICPWYPRQRWFNQLRPYVSKSMFLPPACYLSDDNQRLRPAPPWRTVALRFNCSSALSPPLTSHTYYLPLLSKFLRTGRHTSTTPASTAATSSPPQPPRSSSSTNFFTTPCRSSGRGECRKAVINHI